MFQQVGRLTLNAIDEFLAISSLPYAALKATWLERGKSRSLVVDEAIRQLYFTAVQPLPLFLTLGTLFGVVATVGGYRILSVTPFAEHLATVLVRALAFELSPLIIALVLIGRSGTAVATEIGYMRANQQIDAMEAEGINVEYFVVLPRLVGITLATVGLTVAMGATSLVGGLVVGKLIGVVGVGLQLRDIVRATEAWLLGLTLLKGIATGTIIAAVNCHFGLSVSRGFTDIPRANVQGSVRCYLGCVAVQAALSLYVLAFHTPLPGAPTMP